LGLAKRPPGWLRASQLFAFQVCERNSPLNSPTPCKWPSCCIAKGSCRPRPAENAPLIPTACESMLDCLISYLCASCIHRPGDSQQWHTSQRSTVGGQQQLPCVTSSGPAKQSMGLNSHNRHVRAHQTVSWRPRTRNGGLREHSRKRCGTSGAAIAISGAEWHAANDVNLCHMWGKCRVAGHAM
jgi:hypothetical protein